MTKRYKMLDILNWPKFKWKKTEGQERSDAQKDLLGDAHRVMQSSMSVDFDFSTYAQRHLFNRLSEKSEYGFYYFPYGYLFRYPKWGTINETGFRMADNTYEVRRKYPDHFIIAIFGGSTGFSILVPDEETFANQIELILNQSPEVSKALGRPVKVVNLSHPGNMLINQMFSYTLFCERIKPDLVISHNGANDLCTAQTNDRNLVENYQIAYADVLEAWGRKIHDAEDVEIDYLYADPNSHHFQPAKVRNRPEAVIESYHTRVKQFYTMVRANGAYFISGFQPWITSKGQLTSKERSALKSYNPYYQPVYDNIPHLMELYSKRLTEDQLDYTLNLHEKFSVLGDDTEHFGDVCHTLTAGDRVLAELYCEKVMEAISA